MEQLKDESKVKGAKARAEKLSPDQRKEIAIKAASARWQSGIPKANYEGTLNIANTQIPCAVYDNGEQVLRVIVQREVVGLLTGNKKGNLDRYLQAQNLQPYVPEKFKNKTLDQATIVLEINRRKAFCYEGEDIVDLCKMYLNARKAGNVLLPSQAQLADRAEIIITSLAKTGIVGLIDEATGYQHIRARDALQAYLDRVLRKELAAWVRKFPNEFFEQIYRLNGWTWTGTHFRPAVVGKYIKDVVYERLGPGILAELEKLNPKNEKGHRPAHHHRWLTEDVGHPMLAQHLYAVIGLMRVSNNWREFKALLSKAYQKSGDQLSLLP
ncbi:MAG: P63C domain-containing protein [Nitrospirae bacterium]|nr:P63C domain-containing protein [Nitrospirota bacterium]MCL5977051.1 P63C domain-containing protein [Nitrospirota bacterium]